MHFAKLVEVLDRTNVTFVSVTQAFNATTAFRVCPLSPDVQSLSTVRRQTGILVHVHPVLPWNLKSQQPQLPGAEPDGRPTESSHLVNNQSSSEF
jgi:hypothetical protein